MPLNKVTVLDKGYVSFVGAMHREADLAAALADIPNINPSDITLQSAQASFLIRCPLFVQLIIAKSGLACVQMPMSGDPEAYLPTTADIGASEVETNRSIAEHIEQTIAALLISMKAYQQDGCAPYIAHIVAPLSTYNELLVHGSLQQWISFVTADLPNTVKQYQDVIRDHLIVDWPSQAQQLKRNGEE